MAKETKRVYAFSRGELYKCTVIIMGDDIVVFKDIIAPAGTSDQILNTMFDDAEREALKLYQKDTG